MPGMTKPGRPAGLGAGRVTAYTLAAILIGMQLRAALVVVRHEGPTGDLVQGDRQVKLRAGVATRTLAAAPLEGSNFGQVRQPGSFKLLGGGGVVRVPVCSQLRDCPSRGVPSASNGELASEHWPGARGADA